MDIIPMSSHHWEEVKRIYEAGIATGNATFETQAPVWEKWDESHVKDLRFVATEGEKVVGWAAVTAVSGRCVYAGVGEVSVYVDPTSQGKGIGKTLLTELIRQSEQKGFWTLQAGIFPENIASIKIHEHLGFRVIGRRERIGKMKGIWRDTVLLERRSLVTGVE